MKKKKDNKKFIERTIKALDQHGRRLEKGEISYDRTLFINACVGLLLVPSSTIYDQLPNEVIDDWGISSDKITMEDKDGNNLEELKTVKEVIRHLRNAIAHNHFNFDSGDECECGCIPIDDIEFVDINLYNKRTKRKKGEKKVHNFKVQLTFEEFKQFIENVAKYTIREVQN